MTSPRLPRFLLAACVDPVERTYLLSDLHEEYESLAVSRGARAARRWYWSQAIRSLGPSVARRVSKPRRPFRGRKRRGPEWLSDVRQDVRYAARGFLRTPVFTLVSLLTLMLGIGASTAIFSVVNAVLFRPLPYPDAHELVTVWEVNRERGDRESRVSPPNFLDWEEHNEAFAQIAVVSGASHVWTEGDHPERIDGQEVSPSFFPMLGVTPLHGRLFVGEDAEAGAPRVAVIGHGFWQRWFGGDPAAVGQSAVLDGERYGVVGVLPPDFDFLEAAEIWTPARFSAADRQEALRGARYLEVIARVKTEMTVEQAQASMSALAERLAPERPNNAGWGITLKPLHEHVVEDVRFTLLLIFAAVGFVMLIVCANVANLVVARSTRRLKESALRAALGASRGRLFRHAVTESLLLSLAGGALGLLAAQWLLRPLVALAPADVPRLEGVGLDGAVLLFATGVSVVTGLVFGVAASLLASRADPARFLRTSGRDDGLGRTGLRRALIVGEVALSLVLLIGAGLMTRSFIELRRVDPGFAHDDVMVVWLQLSGGRYQAAEAKAAFYDRLVAQVAGVDGVTSAGIATNVPMIGSTMRFGYWIDGRERNPDEQLVSEYHAVSPDYFRTMGIPLVRGRSFTAAEDAGSQQAVVINQTLAARHWGDGDPVGGRMTVISQTGPVSREIVGVIGDVRHAGLASLPREEVYVPMASDPWPYAVLVLRLDESAGGVVDGVRAQVASLDPSLPITTARPMNELIAGWHAPLRFQMTLVGSFALLALLLAAIGIYGIISYFVGTRANEIGVRVALGAGRRDVMRMVVGQGIALAGTGIVLGLGGAALLMRLLRSLLFEVTPYDPVTFVTITAAIVGVSVLASYLPARRAMRVDPVEALRAE